MADVYEFRLWSDGDMAAGLRPWEEKVTVIFHEQEVLHGKEREEFQEDLRQSLAENADALCEPYYEYELREQEREYIRGGAGG